MAAVEAWSRLLGWRQDGTGRPFRFELVETISLFNPFLLWVVDKCWILGKPPSIIYFRIRVKY